MAAAAAQGNVQPAPGAPPPATPQANQRGVYQGNQVPPPFDPAFRFVRERMEYIQGEEEFRADRIVIEQRNNLEEAEQIADMRARLGEEQFFYHFSQNSAANPCLGKC